MVRARSSGSPDGVRRLRQFLDQFDQAAAQQGFAAGEADLFDAEADEELDEAEVFVDRQFGVLCAEFAGAAVDALVVAAVGDGDAQVVDDAAVAIGQPRGRHHRGRRNWGSGSHPHPFRLYRFAALCSDECA